MLRGAKATSPLMERPHERGPALQYLDDVDPGGVADMAGLKKGDYLIKVCRNGSVISCWDLGIIHCCVSPFYALLFQFNHFFSPLYI